jgi:hypothetical protein
LLAYRIHSHSHVRETRRSKEIQELVEQGKIPHDIELQQHPEKSIQGLSCKPYQSNMLDCAFLRLFVGLMGRVAGSIKEIKPAKEMSVAPPYPDAKSD